MADGQVEEQPQVSDTAPVVEAPVVEQPGEVEKTEETAISEPAVETPQIPASKPVEKQYSEADYKSVQSAADKQVSELRDRNAQLLMQQQISEAQQREAYERQQDAARIEAGYMTQDEAQQRSTLRHQTAASQAYLTQINQQANETARIQCANDFAAKVGHGVKAEDLLKDNTLITAHAMMAKAEELAGKSKDKEIARLNDELQKAKAPRETFDKGPAQTAVDDQSWEGIRDRFIKNPSNPTVRNEYLRARQAKGLNTN